MSIKNNSSSSCVYCTEAQKSFRQSKCFCEDEFDTINIDRQRYLFLQSPESWHCFFLKPVKEFLLERGLPDEICKYCNYSNLNCSCGQKTAFKKSVNYFASLYLDEVNSENRALGENKESIPPPTKKARKEKSIFYWPSLF